MNLSYKIESFVKGRLTSFKALQVIIAGVCIFIPVVLRVTDKDEFYVTKINPAGLSTIKNCRSVVKIDTTKNTCSVEDSLLLQLKVCETGTEIITIRKIWKDNLGFRFSLSEYAYSSKSYLFGLLYCMAAMLFIFNGVTYMKKKDYLALDKNGHWYNIFIGIFLIGVVFSPQCDLPVLHIVFTVLFFAGNLITLFFARNPGESRLYVIVRRLMAVLILVAVGMALIPREPILSVLYAEWISLTFIGIHLIMVILSSHWTKKRDASFLSSGKSEV